jgi:hypothetical protein
MSKGLILLSVTSVGVGGLVWYVHKQQREERERMYDGVVRDLERQNYRKQQQKPT